MDTGEGRFEEINPEGVIGAKDSEEKIATLLEESEAIMKKKYPKHGGTFKVGDTMRLRGSLFRVKAIKPTELRLKLIKENEK